MTSSPARTALVALIATLAIQIFTSLVGTAPAVLAPMLAPDLGVAPNLIGVFVGLIFTGAMVGSLACGGFVARYGAIRVSQASVLLCSIGIAAVALVPASAAALLIGAAFVLGLGYGPITAASSALLIRTTPSNRLALTFSIKQTGVPAGAALAGAILPAAALLLGWRATFLAIAALGLVVIAGAQPSRAALDSHRGDGKGVSLAAVFGPLKTVIRSPSLLELSLSGLALAGVQACFTSFLVVYLKDELEWSLVSAGLALTCATVAAVIGRIAWGAVADRGIAPMRVLAIIGGGAAVCGVAMALATSAWPIWVMLPLAAVFGATASGWNGVQLAELARRAPAGTAGAVTGASGFISFGGVVLGPIVFAGLSGLTGGYRAGFLFSAAVSATVAGILLRRSARG